ncbi:MAG: pitrilysin family protein [Chitinophagaceae bacterium]
MLLDRTKTPAIKSAIDLEYELLDCQQRKLQNDIALYYINQGSQEVMQLEFVFKAGLWYEPQKGIAQATAALLKSGTSSKTSFEINAEIEQYGASIKSQSGVDFSSLTLSCLSKHASKVLPLIFELLTDTQYPASELAIYIQNALQRLSVYALKGDFIANRKIDELLFGAEHPYGRFMESQDYQQIDSKSLQSYRQTYFTSSNCTIFLAGKFAESLLNEIDILFGSKHWNETPIPQAKSYEPRPSDTLKYHAINDEKSVQSAIRIAAPCISKQHPDFYKLIILNTVLGGYFGSRLMSNIREDKGYTYGIHSYMYNHVKHSAYMISTEVGRDVAQQAVTEIYYEMNLLREQLIDDEELLLVKNYLLGSILGDLDGPFHIIQRWKNLILNNFPKEKFYENINLYKHISAKELQQLALQYFDPNTFYEVVIS